MVRPRSSRGAARATSPRIKCVVPRPARPESRPRGRVTNPGLSARAMASVPRASASSNSPRVARYRACAPSMFGRRASRLRSCCSRLAEAHDPIQLPDILAAPAESRVRGALVRAGYRALFAVPLVREDHLLGGLTVIRKTKGQFAPEVIELLRTFATQSALAIQNARLFCEIEQKSRELEVANQHKSEFLANMSHE